MTIDEDLKKLLNKMLSEDPDQRPQSVEAVMMSNYFTKEEQLQHPVDNIWTNGTTLQ